MTDDTRPPSKTRRKRDAHDLQSLGETLLGLKPEKLRSLGLGADLYDALIEGQKMSSREALRRHRQYIGRLMRDIDASDIRRQLGADRDAVRRAALAFQQVEQWRDRLLDEPAGLGEFMRQHPAADANTLRRLIDEVHAETAHGKPPRAARALFRALSTALGNGSQAQAAPAAEAP
ncbi:MAG: ribosome biogenesis factor YjgA [Burkholderiales bacterium]